MKKSKKSTELIHPHFVSVWLSDMDLDLLDQGCTILGISRSEYLRKLLTNKKRALSERFFFQKVPSTINIVGVVLLTTYHHSS